MADSTMLASNKPFFIPDFAPEFVMHAALAVRIDRLGKNIAPRFAHRYYQSVAACTVVEAKGACENELDARCSAFDGAFMLGNAVPIADIDASKGVQVEVKAQIDDNDSTCTTPLVTRQQIDELVAEASKYFTLKMGDYIVACTDDGNSHQLHIGEQLSGSVNDTDSLIIRIK